MSIIQDVEKGFSDVTGEIKKIVGSAKTKDIIEESARISALLVVALPYAQQVADAVLPVDAPLIAAAVALGIEINKGLQSLSNAEKLSLVSKATQIAVADKVAAGGSFQLGNTALTTPAQVAEISQHTLDAAAQVSYSLGVATAKVQVA